METQPSPNYRKLSFTKTRHLFIGIPVLFLGLFVGLLIGEAMFRVLEYRDSLNSFRKGKGGWVQLDKRWGWKPTLGSFHEKTPEFEVTGTINSLHMNDEPFNPKADLNKTRILALGDSHTFATGASMKDTWPKILQRQLNDIYSPNTFRVYNAGVGGYSLHQYLLRLIDQGPIVRPHYVIIGLSYASDLMDLLPPRQGGWIYFEHLSRDYFDFDSSGKLVLKHWERDTDKRQIAAAAPSSLNWAKESRRLLQNFALFRFLRRSNLALAIGSKIRIQGQSLWPTMQIVLEKKISPENEYAWKLLKALILKLKSETEHQGATLLILGIPYLPQIYDALWKSTFGNNPEYARDAAPKKLQGWCKSQGITYIESLQDYQNKLKTHNRWVHHRRDAHPTAEGHEIAASTLLRSGHIKPQTR